MSAGQPIIQVESLSKVYGLRPALRGLDLRIMPGESVALLGENGSGKTTLLRLLAGLSKPSAGSIRVGGWRMPQDAASVRAQIGLVAHRPLLYDNLSARENLDFFGKLYAINSEEREERISQVLRQVGLGRRAHSLTRELSRGMRQRLSIARAILHEPHLLLFDEPYTGLDQAAARYLDEILRSARAAGKSVICSTHQLERVTGLAARAIALSGGRIAYDGVTTDLSPDDLARIMAGEAAPA